MVTKLEILSERVVKLDGVIKCLGKFIFRLLGLVHKETTLPRIAVFLGRYINEEAEILLCNPLFDNLRECLLTEVLEHSKVICRANSDAH